MSLSLFLLFALASADTPVVSKQGSFEVLATCAVSTRAREFYVGSVENSGSNGGNERPTFYQIRQYQKNSQEIRLYKKNSTDPWSDGFLTTSEFDPKGGMAVFDIGYQDDFGVYSGKIVFWALDTDAPSMIKNIVRLTREDAWSDLSSKYFHSADEMKSEAKEMSLGKTVLFMHSSGDCSANAVETATTRWNELSKPDNPIGGKK